MNNRFAGRFLCSPTRLLLLVVAAFFAVLEPGSLVKASQPSGPPLFKIYLPGFVDQTHTASFGLQRSSIIGFDAINPSILIGTSDRFSGATSTGESGWEFDLTSGTTTQVGLLDAQFFKSPGQAHRTIPAFVNSSGQIVGTTSTDSTSSDGRNWAWFYDPTTGLTTHIGYTLVQQMGTPPGDQIRFLQEDGFVAGLSSYNSSRVTVAWSYDPASGITQRIGLPDAAVPRPDVGPITETVEGISIADLVVGTSTRFSQTSGNSSGPAVWVYDPQTNTTTRVGFFDSAHTYANGQQESRFSAMNSHGLVGGISYRPDNRSDAWLYDPLTGATAAIGYANPTDGSQWTDQVTAVTEQDRVYGVSTNATITKPWVYDRDSASLTPLGLTAGEYVLSNGGSQNKIVAYASSGFVLGQAQRGVGDTRRDFNQTPWIYDPTARVTYPAGLTAGNYTSTAGGRWAVAQQINQSGQAIGTSELFYQGSSGSIVRNSAWFYDPATHATIELAQALAESRLISFNNPIAISNRGQVVGIARNTNGTPGSAGDFVWFYDHTTGVTLTDFDVRNSFTVKSSAGASLYIQQLTDTGLVLGQNARHDSNGADAGNTMWLFDSNTDKTYDLTFSQQAQRGLAFTNVLHLADDGTMFGEYDAYSGNSLLGRRYFYWSIQYGFHDLQSLIVGDINAQGWSDILHTANFTAGLHYVNDNFMTGVGLRSNGNSLQFALVRIPEPQTIYLLAAGLFPLCVVQLTNRCRYALRS